MEISVIIPVYNGEKTIASTLKSLAEQDFTQEWEVLIVDDGSTDRTNEEIREFGYQYPHLNMQLITQSNQGDGIARNTGIQKANGKYVFFSDSDDIVLPHALSSLYRAANTYNADVVVAGYTQVDNTREEKHFIPEAGNYTSQKALCRYLTRTINVGIGNTLVRRSIITENTLSFHPFVYRQDHHFFERLMFYVARVITLPISVYCYITRQGSTMQQPFSIKQVDALKAIEDVRAFYLQQGGTKKIIHLINLRFLIEAKFVLKKACSNRTPETEEALQYVIQHMPKIPLIYLLQTPSLSSKLLYWFPKWQIKRWCSG